MPGLNLRFTNRLLKSEIYEQDSIRLKSDYILYIMQDFLTVL